ncbi:hypothetical protein Tph_c06340 [Thermacetogenium phaeum DSM 12270]|uniref:Uncharacterized protein n=1 Tax=Thermacetogenium phaeum (strain ATCC BAA-254 / DSM 26808 / PB) TaxID=1089553 RepID=K4LDJ1_THEPS|nr:hypothetical protein Tph_c06340 [Thermacetogenium phaeum DSM 12270]
MGARRIYWDGNYSTCCQIKYSVYRVRSRKDLLYRCSIINRRD